MGDAYLDIGEFGGEVQEALEYIARRPQPPQRWLVHPSPAASSAGSSEPAPSPASKARATLRAAAGGQSRVPLEQTAWIYVFIMEENCEELVATMVDKRTVTTHKTDWRPQVRLDSGLPCFAYFHPVTRQVLWTDDLTPIPLGSFTSQPSISGRYVAGSSYPQAGEPTECDDADMGEEPQAGPSHSQAGQEARLDDQHAGDDVEADLGRLHIRPRPDSYQDWREVQVTIIPHRLRADELRFRDANHRTIWSIHSQWRKAQRNGQPVWTYDSSASGLVYFTLQRL